MNISATINERSPSEPRSSRIDSLATGVIFLLVATVLQRLVGFGRGVLFCRFLDDDQLGQWSLAFSFLLFAAPLAVLGLPGSFGRYTEYYRSRGQLRSFLRRTTLTTGVLGLIAVGIICLAQEWFGWIIFNDSSATSLVLLLGGTLATVIFFNFIIELLTALRQIRAVSLMRIASSLVFAVTGLSLVYYAQMGAAAVVLAYAAGCLIAALGAVPLLVRCWSEDLPASQPLGQRDLWSKLLPFAGWIWVINALANMFDAADRWMIVHYASLETSAAQSLVGQYHSSRMVPVLLISVAGILGSVMLPYLSHDWEAGRRDDVSRRLNLALKLTALGFTAFAVVVLLTSPWLFGWALQGKYDGGLAVLPWTLVYCIWFSLSLIAQNYLWCAEKAKWGSLAMAIGLGVNILLNMLLLPWLGLLGAVLATTAANGLALLLIYVLSRRIGMQIDLGVWGASLLPLVVLLGAWPAAAAISVIALGAISSNWLLHQNEKQQLWNLITRYFHPLQTMTRLRKTASVENG